MSTDPQGDLVDVDAVRSLVRTIEDAGRDWRVQLTRLVDGVSEYTLTYHGNVSIHEDTDDAYSRLRVLQEAEKMEVARAAILSMSTELSTLRAQCEAQRKALEWIAENDETGPTYFEQRNGRDCPAGNMPGKFAERARQALAARASEGTK